MATVIIAGYDRQLRSTGVNVRRGSAVTLRRVIYTRDFDAGTESVLDISGATAIEWELVDSLKKGTAAKVSKSLGAGIALTGDGTDGSYDLTLAAADTSSLTPGMYFGAVAVVLGGARYKFAPYTVNITSAPDLGG